MPTDPTTLCVNAERVVLQVDANPNIYTALQDIRFNLERPELREPITGLGTTQSGTVITAVYFYGPGDNYIEGTLLMSLAEYKTFAATNFLRDVNGKLNVRYFSIKATDLSGNVITIGDTNTGVGNGNGFACTVPKFTLDKPVIGGVKVRIRIRLLGDQVTITGP